jgi:SAM-dependent methyltransferase
MRIGLFLYNRALGIYTRTRYKLALAKARYYDKKFGIKTAEDFGPQEDKNFDIDQVRYSPTFYGVLKQMVDYLKLKEKDVFVDLGCGKGRVVFWVALQKIKKAVGVEINKNLIEIARDNLLKLKLRNSPIDFVQADVVNFDLREGTVFFMFNPFGLETLEKVVNNIKDSLTTNPRKIRIIYYGPMYGNFLDKQDWLIREGKIVNQDCLVWRSCF